MHGALEEEDALGKGNAKVRITIGSLIPNGGEVKTRGEAQSG